MKKTFRNATFVAQLKAVAPIGSHHDESLGGSNDAQASHCVDFHDACIGLLGHVQSPLGTLTARQADGTVEIYVADPRLLRSLRSGPANKFITGKPELKLA